MSSVDTLVEMGFVRNRAEKAMAKTQYKGVQQAMEWLLAHSEDADIDDPFEAPKGHTLGDPDAAEAAPTEMETTPAVAVSMKCDDCGKLLRSTDDAQAHAARTQHTSFSESTEEIKPLTAEEKAKQLDQLREKMKQRKEEKVQQEKQEKIQKEKIRRSTGKEMVAAKAKLEEMEMRKALAARKREKEEDRLAKQRVKEQLEKDKKERQAKFSKQTVAEPTPPPAATPPVTATPAEKKAYDKCTLRIRLTNGSQLVQDFGAKEPLSAVRLYVEMNRTDGDGAFQLKTSYPPKLFCGEDLDKPLDTLGLVPSAVLMITKS